MCSELGSSAENVGTTTSTRISTSNALFCVDLKGPMDFRGGYPPSLRLAGVF